ncbi:MAG TPA: energy transducer TonB [Bacteroidales bacterium]|nr:energy transducer TonB [Bacteroidales bacterium]HPS17552.1 energy transducer TonB [Bacteroidales bacterium]
MKKRIIISLISLMIISATGSFANTTATIDSPSKVEKLLKKTITFPEFAKQEKIEGVVLVSFTVNNDGTLKINLTNESSETLKKYVIEKIKSIKLLPGNREQGKTYNVKFEFKYEK